MAGGMTKKLPSMRWLEAHNIPYQVLLFPDTMHSAAGVADHLGLLPSRVYKTLVVMRLPTRPSLVLVAGDREIQLKRLAQALGEKRLRMATQKEAEAYTGLQVGGISALALRHRHYPVYIDRPARDLETMVVSAGQRGVDLQLAVTDLVRVTGAVFVEATASEGHATVTDT